MNSKFIALYDSKKIPAFITPFTSVHFLFGIFANLLSRKLNLSFKCSFILWSFIHLVYEIKDVYYSYALKYTNYLSENSILNSIGDQIFGMLGFLVGQKLNSNFNTLITLLILTLISTLIGLLIKIG